MKWEINTIKCYSHTGWCAWCHSMECSRGESRHRFYYVFFQKKILTSNSATTLFSTHFQLLVLLKNWAFRNGPSSCNVVTLALCFLGTLDSHGLRDCPQQHFWSKKESITQARNVRCKSFYASFPSATSFPWLPILKKTPVGVWHKAKQSSWQSLNSKTIPVVLSNKLILSLSLKYIALH